MGRCTLALVAAGLAAFGLASGAVTPPAAAQSVQAAPPVTLDVALDRTATYIDSFIDHFGNVVSEERYQQEAVPAIRMGQLGGRGSMASVPQTQKRTLRSDFLLVKPEGSADWFPFRDVYEVDGNAIRDREGRLAKLFLKDSGIALDRAREIAKKLGPLGLTWSCCTSAGYTPPSSSDAPSIVAKAMNASDHPGLASEMKNRTAVASAT